MNAIYDLLAQPPTAYLILFAIAAGDAIFPVLPSESAAIVAGVLAAIEPEISLPAMLGAAAAGAFVGDSTSYALGRFGGQRAQRRFFDGPYVRRGVRWACIELRRRGGTILLVARFVPGGRTGATFTSGLTGYPYGRFALYTGIAACLWALYAVLLGYFGGRVFEERPLLAVGAAFALAAAIALASVAGRRFVKRVRQSSWSSSTRLRGLMPMRKTLGVRPTQAEKAEAFSALHDGEPFVIPNPWDAGSARVLEALGFKALASTSSGFAFTLGRPDGAATLDEVAEHTRALDDATSLPVSVDLENGYGPRPEDAALAVTKAAGAGAVGGSIEDYDPSSGIYELGHALERVAAAVEAARAQDFPFTLTARAENHIRGNPDLEDTISRLQAYEAAGADVLYAPGLRSVEEIKAVCDAVAKPVNVLAVPGLTMEELAEAGARRVSVGGSLTWVALSGMVAAAEAIRDRGDFGALAAPVRLDEWLAPR